MEINSIATPGELVWLTRQKCGYCLPLFGQDFQYDGVYWSEYQRRSQTPMGEILTKIRLDFTRQAIGDEELIDFGIGSGQFLEARGGNTYGYDINPMAIAWLMERKRFSSPWIESGARNVSCWDSLEHLENPSALVRKVRHAMLLSLPIFDGPDQIMKSKHFKPGEHLWYWTDEGLKMFFELLGFHVTMESDAETRAGRESIKSYCFRRKQ